MKKQKKCVEKLLETISWVSR